jgi:hypothetical protein
MPDDDLINLRHQVDSHEEELTDQTKIIKKLEQRVSVLEKDVKALISLCQYIRLFGHVHPGMEQKAEDFDAVLTKLRERYGIPRPE